MWINSYYKKIKNIGLFNITDTNLLVINYFNNHNSSKVEKFIVDKKIDLMINLGTPRILRNNILKIESKVINFNVKTFADPQQAQYIALTIRMLVFNA